ncbi:MAG: FtsX-like permease family protein [Betaproteobacteria bacterium]|jgi:putative ABC transport system permease protein|nr:FtsX-like permease family protein [Betaproteobacteria bacterium]
MTRKATLPLRMLARDWRAGELRVLAAALVIAVASVTSVAFFADRVRQALVRDAHQLLGGDLLLVADEPWPDNIRDEIAKRRLRQAEATWFISMARHGDVAHLSGIKAVSSNYPLRGRMRIADAPNAADRPTEHGPDPGTVWLDERLFSLLNLKVGESIELGDARLKVAAVLTLEPDRGASFFNLAPRVMMSLADVPATGLVQTGSRVYYYLVAAGEAEAINALGEWLKPRLGRGQRLESLENARPAARATIERAEQFIGLTALLAVILAAVAIALSTRRFTRRHLDGYAVMRCLGATQRRLVSLFAWEFAVLGILASALGCALGFAVQAGLEYWLGRLFVVPLPAPTIRPALQGFGTGIVILLGFAVPPLLQLKNVPALRVIRRDAGPAKQGALVAYGIGLAAFAGLIFWQAGSAKLAGYVLGGFLVALVVSGALGYFLIQMIAKLGARARASWHYGLASLRRRSVANTVQVSGLALGLTAILLLTFTRGDLLEAWRAKTPPDAPNRFILNIQPDQRVPLAEFFAAEHLPPPVTYPMVRGRLMAINDRAVNAETYEDQRTKRLVEREFNLSFMEDLPAHNSVSVGRWFQPQDLARGALSVEEGIAKRLNIGVGDTLTWSVAGREFTAPVTNLRKLNWDSMRVNFFVITTPNLLDDRPTSYLTSFYLPGGAHEAMNRLIGRFSNLTVVDMSAILNQVLRIVDQVVNAVQIVFLFALAAGVLVLYSALLATQDERLQEAAVMRALGAARAQIAKAQQAEFLALGLIAGMLASISAFSIGYVLADRVFNFPYAFSSWIWVAGPILGLACVSFNAWMGARAALNHPPMLALREAA